MDVRSRERIQIPVYKIEKEYPYKAIDSNTEMIRMRERTIIIPEIIITKRTY